MLRADDDYNRDVRRAWLTAALSRTPPNKRLPKLTSLYAKPQGKTQSLDEMRMALRVLSEQYGYPIKESKTTH